MSSTNLSPMMAGLQLGGPTGTSPASSSVLSLASADPYDEAEDADATKAAASLAGPSSGVSLSGSSHPGPGQPDGTSYSSNAESFSTEAAEKLIDEMHKLQDRIYEIQELRHASTQATHLASHLSALEARVSDLSNRIDKALADLSLRPNDPLEADLRLELESEWGKLLSARALLREEVKEDGWLVRFRATADQAEAMMQPLQNSLAECQYYLDSNLNVGRQDHLLHHRSPDLDRLKSLAKGHETMKSSYVPSIVKVLKMMERSLASRTTRNGEALRRHAELSARWHKLQASLIELDAKLDYFINEDGQSGERYPAANGSPSSPFGSSSTLSGLGHGLPRDGLSSGHRSSFSSASVASGSSSSQKASLVSPPSSHLPLRSRDSLASMRSSATATSSARAAPSYPNGHGGQADSSAITPRAAARQSSFGFPRDDMAGAVSPSPSKGVGADGSGSTTPSRIPVSRMRSVSDFKAPQSPSTRSVSETLRPKTPTLPTSRGMPQSARSGRMSLGAARTPSAGARIYSSTGPSTAPRPRQSLSRAPPSSYRPVSPTPPVPALPRGLAASTSSLAPPRAGASSRPSSRMSTSSSVPWSREHGVGELTPFHPSPYDPLDQRMQQILDATDWREFVARVDPPLKKGQRKGENEDCKGEFVFREGEKPVGVKMLRIARGKEVRDKVMVRTGSMWIDLEGWLRKRQEESLGVYG